MQPVLTPEPGCLNRSKLNDESDLPIAEELIDPPALH
jgi:hypothetical protein